MKNQMRWQVFLQVTSPDKAKRLLQRLAQAAGPGMTVVECERYWKDPSLYRATLTSPVPPGELSTAVVETLRICSHVAGRWIVGAPQVYEGDRWEFSGSAVKATICIPGLTDVDFHVGNLATSEQQPVAQHEEIAP